MPGQFLRELPYKFPLKDGQVREGSDFQFLDMTTPQADGCEELIRLRIEKDGVEEIRKRLEPGKTYELVINRLGWDKVPIIYRGRVLSPAKG